MNSPSALPIRNFLSQQVSAGATVGQVADMVATAWQNISAALAPVIGQRGVAALYKRSLHLAAEDHPWLAKAYASGLVDMDLGPLRAALVQRDSQDAAAAGATLLLAFDGLVASLIGPALSGQLLGAMWINFFRGSAAQDPPS